MRDKKGVSNGITDKEHAGCFVTSFCSSFHNGQRKQMSPDVSQASSPKPQRTQQADTNFKSNFVGQNGLPVCKMLIMGNFTLPNQRKDSFLSNLKWQKLPGANAPKFYSEKSADHQLIIHDISFCDINSFKVTLCTSTFIVIIPSSALDLSLCCHAVFNKSQILADECKVVYLNLAEQKSAEFSAIEDEAKKWINKQLNFSSVALSSISELIKEAVDHSKTVSEQLSDSNSKGM